jgi:hypothetical protein
MDADKLLLLLCCYCCCAGTAGRLLMDADKLLPFNRQFETNRPRANMKNPAERVSPTQLRCV